MGRIFGVPENGGRSATAIRFWLALLCALVALGAVSAQASATRPVKFIGRPGGVMPKVGHLAPGQTRPAAPALAPVTCPALDSQTPPKPTPSPSCNMTYHSGPLLLTNNTHVIYWEPAGSSVSANYHSLINQFLGDVAADSGRATNPYATDTQYTDSTNAAIQYSSTFAGALTDTNAFPASGCTATAPATTCLTETQQSKELDQYLKDNSLPRGASEMYFLVMPKNVNTCFDDGTACGPYGNGTKSGYCAYHTQFNLGNGLTTWANEPYAAGGSCFGGITKPNADDADVTINTISHEQNEAITDPNVGGGWFDANGSGENGDKCAYNFGPAIGTTSGGIGYDVLINHHSYDLQSEWSNATGPGATGCTMTYGAQAPTASFTSSPASPKATDSVSFDGTGSKSNNTGGYITNYSWDFGDGSAGSGATPSHAYSTSGTFTVTLTVTDDAGLTAAVFHDVVVVTRPTTMTYGGATSGDFNDPVTVSATMTDSATSAGVAGRTIDFTLGTQSCSASTDAAGFASCSITINQDPTGTSVKASFVGDTVYTTSADSKPFTINQEESKLTYSGDVTAHYHDSATVTATLTDPDGGAAIGGKQVKFTLGVGDTCTATTTTAGVASCTIVVHQTGSQTLSDSFSGDTDYVASGGTQSFSITPEETTMAYTGPTVILASSGVTTLKATLVEDGSNDTDGDGGSPAPLPAESVTLSVGTQSCSGTTDLTGNVSCTIPSVTVPLGPELVSAAFSGDAYYQAASDSKTAIVFAFPRRGAFVLGDKSVSAAAPTTNLTWWGDQWWSINKVSGGAAPPAFKGFAGSVSTLPTTSPANSCGTTLTTAGGNSPPPTSGVPSYMGVLVASRLDKSGAAITGLWGKIVVVKVNPGYAPNPGSPGSGKLVATFC